MNGSWQQHSCVRLVVWMQNITSRSSFEDLRQVGLHNHYLYYALIHSHAMFRRTASLCLPFALCAMTEQNATFWGLRTPAGGYDLQIRTRLRFLCSLIILCLFVRKLSCWHTNPQTNRRRRKHPTFFATLRCWVKKLGNHANDGSLL